MENSVTLQFEKPSFFKRLKGMLGVDFYRLFHTPLLYIFLIIAALIPALVSMGAMGGEGEATGMFTNAWQIVAASKPLYVISDIGEYANMNMVFIFGGIMISIFIGHDYKSGYVKQLFTTHAKKQDYMMSKTLLGAFSMACMCVTYLIGGMIAGAATGLLFEINAGSLICAILGKMIMSLGWASLYTFINVIFRSKFGISIALCFILGTGIPVIGAAALIGNTPALNIFLYGSSVYACLSSNALTLLICLMNSVVWAVVYNVLGWLVLSRRDCY
ncbi:MAG: ABC transporter permease [Clostridia bacterium]|nr:ABC transporter permease [Clostridia bacterium]